MHCYPDVKAKLFYMLNVNEHTEAFLPIKTHIGLQINGMSERMITNPRES